MLILAGIAIASLTGDNGLFKRAQQARQETEEAQDMEKIRLAVLEAQIGDNGYQEIDATTFQEALNSQFEGRDLQVTDNKDGSFTVNLDNMSKMYYVDSNGEIINNENMLAIGTADELKAFRDDVNSGNSYEGKYVYLTDNITLDIDEEWEPIGYYDQATEDSKKPDTDSNRPFRGVFDGKGFTIDNVYINTSNNVQGIFGLVIDGEIKNVNLGENSILSMSGSATGGIVGYMYNIGKISNCNNYANIEQTRGGIVGIVAGSITISNCINYGDLNNAYGGIVGSSNGTDWEEFSDVQHTIINCGNYGNITKNTDNDYLGGIVGYFKGTISNSFNNGEVLMNANRKIVGGIAGEIYGKIENCYNIADISGVGHVGGITGTLAGNIMNCYTIANITGNSNIGTFYGYKSKITSSTVENCYSKNDTFTYLDLGDAFKEDKNNINNGYPILSWQQDQTIGN